LALPVGSTCLISADRRIADPGNHHRPALDAAQAVHALFERGQLEQAVDVERHRLLDFALDAHRPGTGLEGVGVFGRIGLVGTELVEVVVARGVLEGRLLVDDGIGGIEGGGQLGGRRLGEGFAVRHFPQRAAGDGAERHVGDEGAAPRRRAAA
jgi:hypothetical protein